MYMLHVFLLGKKVNSYSYYMYMCILFWTLLDHSSVIFLVVEGLYIIVVGPQLTVLIVEVSLFQSIHV